MFLTASIMVGILIILLIAQKTQKKQKLLIKSKMLNKGANNEVHQLLDLTDDHLISISIEINESLNKQVVYYSNLTKINTNEFINSAIRSYLDTFKKKSTRNK